MPVQQESQLQYHLMGEAVRLFLGLGTIAVFVRHSFFEQPKFTAYTHYIRCGPS